MCQRLGLRHTTTKVRHPWTNGYVERLNKLKENGYRTPAEAHFSRKYLTKNEFGGKIRVGMIRNREEVQEKTNLGGDFIKGKGEKEEVLACQFVTTS